MTPAPFLSPRLLGFAALLKAVEDELADAQTEMDARALPKSECANNYIAATCIAR